ncbi:cellulose binding domain-containing protein [Paenibacillus sp. YYML68]|uniref:cellulose binding domain-containing protein n=1 Tax=Paenibacillus sp. YYML68 TaxID=2909250 RepID=UPI00248F48EE|nr:cellulose binding domain-containing protein [Paenibacillus sp. YYML68]
MTSIKKAWFTLLMITLVFSIVHAPGAAHAATNVYVDTTAKLQAALLNAQPGHTILVAPGTYELTTTTTVGTKEAYYYGTANGTSTNPITIKSQDPANPATLKGGNVASVGYTLYITGDYWVIQDLNVTHGQKGIILDNSNYTRINGVTVSNVGQEGIHVRDGSSNVTIENSTIKDTGVTGTAYDKGFAEGIYIGSDRSVWDVNSPTGYNRQVYNTTVRNTTIGPNVAAESIDLKEGTIGTLIEGNTFLGAGISGENFADSFIDVKGVQVTMRNNVGYRQNNSNITKDIAEVNRTSSNPWCPAAETSNGNLTNTADGNTYTNNTFHAGNPPVNDTQAPTAPTSLAAAAASSTQINLSWTASTDNVAVAGYRVYRGGTQVGTASSTSYSDTGLTASTAYSYTVRAYDAVGNVSSASNTASATTTSSGGGGSTASLKLQYEEGDGGASADNRIKPYFKIINTGATAIPLSELKIRYYYKKEANVSQQFNVDYALMGKSNVTGAFQTLSSPKPTADTYLEVGFTTGAGSLAAGGDTGSIKVRMNNSDWSNYNEANDYSYDASRTSLADYSKITIHHNGTLVWGTAP